MIAAVKKVAIDEGCRDEIKSELVDRVILKELKTVKEQLDTCPESREDLKAEYQARYDVIAKYAPKQMDADEIKAYLEEKGHEVINIGTDTHDSCNYPEYGEKAGRMVAAGEVDGGVLICGTGVGISIAANKVKGVRAAVCSEPVTARLVKEHNNANIIAFGARIVGSEMAKAIVDAWLDAEYIGSGRHERRVNMIEEEAAKYNK